MAMNKIEKNLKTGLTTGLSIAQALSKASFTIAEEVCCGVENLSNHFVNAPQIGIGKSGLKFCNGAINEILKITKELVK